MKISSPLSSFHSISHKNTSGQRTKLYFKLYCQHQYSSQDTVTVPTSAVMYSLNKQNLFFPRAAVIIFSYCRAGPIIMQLLVKRINYTSAWKYNKKREN